MRQMYTDPKIATSDDLTKRSYITFYFQNARIREYNGNCIGLNLYPNRAPNIAERDILLKKLKYEIHKSLDAGTYGKASKSSQKRIDTGPVIILSLRKALEEAIKSKLNCSLSIKYERNLKTLHRQLLKFLTHHELENSIEEISSNRLNQFLVQFKLSGTYYMNKRRDLGVLLAAAGKLEGKSYHLTRDTNKMKAKATLHKPYQPEQLKPLFDYLKEVNFRLYLCCLLTYGSWLRPHEEIRLLKVRHFNSDWSEILLTGDENKSGVIRKVFVPEYIRKELTTLKLRSNPDGNIFTGTPFPLNGSYFSTQWGRLRNEMVTRGLIVNEQTIYSFRHTAAIQVYKRTKDIYLLQKLLGHSSIVVTLKYLRSLGEFNSEELRAAAPTL